jgi:hypothetical protein
MSRIFIKPAAPGLKVRKPVNGYLAAEGEEVNADSYWLRRMADGDVIEAPRTAQPAAPQAASL